MRRYRLVVLLVAGLAGLGALLYEANREMGKVETGENVARVDWLPASARNVSFYRSYSFTACEFDIPEQEFLAWAAGEGCAVQRIPAGGKRTVTRYHWYDRRLTYPADPPEDASFAELQKWAADVERYRATQYQQIEHGYFYEYRQDDGGGTTVGYDADAGRAYYQSSPR